jgi:REP element-mobilizing transposase RayT
MPDHIHLFVCGNEEFVLSRWVAMLKQVLAKRNGWRKSRGQIWEEGFFDHIVRNDESMSEKWDYVVKIRFAPDWSTARKIGLIRVRSFR